MATTDAEKSTKPAWLDQASFGHVLFGHQLVQQDVEDIDVDAGPWGRVRFRSYGDGGTILVGSSAGCDAVINTPDDLWEMSSVISFVLDPIVGRILVMNWAGRHVYEVLIERAIINEVADLDRNDDDDPGQYRVSFVQDGDKLLLVYENGILCFDDCGAVLWRQDHSGNTDWCFHEIRDDKVVYSGAWEENWAYRLTDGMRLAV